MFVWRVIQILIFVSLVGVSFAVLAWAQKEGAAAKEPSCTHLLKADSAERAEHDDKTGHDTTSQADTTSQVNQAGKVGVSGRAGKKPVPQRFCPADPADSSGFCMSVQDRPITAKNIVWAYEQGAFPWSKDASGQLNWYNPPLHGVVELDVLFELNDRGQYKMRALRKLMRRAHRQGWRVTFNQSFDRVMQACAEHDRPNVDHVWLTEDVQAAFSQLHRQGRAHSVEVWDAEGNLIGGNYGLWHEGVYSSESMFYRASGAGKFSMYAVMSHLHRMGVRVIDSQVVNFVSGPSFLAQNTPLKKYLQQRREANQIRLRNRALLDKPFARAFEHPTQNLGL